MRAALAAVAVLSAAALAQDSAAPRPVGTALLDALPPQADLVVAAPDLPALLGAATRAGLGDAAAWREAFDAQLAAWGAPTGRPDRLVAGAHALLDAADGEALVAAIPLNAPGKGRVRATLIAFRTTRDDKTLRAAWKDVSEGGLWLRWDGVAREEQVAGRAVVTLPSARGSLHAVLDGGLVAVCDDALALGLFLRGLSAAKTATPAEGGLRLTVRRGRGDAAWEGFAWGERETVQWKDAAARAASIVAEPSPTQVFVVASQTVEDLPLFPSPLAAAAAGPGPGGTTCIGLDGGSLREGRAAGGGATAGAAWRLGWLRALADGKIPAPVPGVDPQFLRAPYESAARAAGASAGEFLAWTSSGPGRLAGPFGHGPATFLALRTLHDIAHGAAPGGAASDAPAGGTRAGAPLPPPAPPR